MSLYGLSLYFETGFRKGRLQYILTGFAIWVLSALSGALDASVEYEFIAFATTTNSYDPADQVLNGPFTGSWNQSFSFGCLLAYITIGNGLMVSCSK